MIGDLISGLLVGVSKAIALWQSGKEDEAKAALEAACKEALGIKDSTAAAHEARDAEIRGASER